MPETKKGAAMGLAALGEVRAVGAADPQPEYSRIPQSMQIPKPPTGWRKPSRWLVRKRLQSLRGAPSRIRKSPPHQTDAVEFSLTVTVRTSPLGYTILQLAMRKIGVRFLLKHMLGQAIEKTLEAWGYPSFVYKVTAGNLSKNDAPKPSENQQDNLHGEGE